MGSSRRSDADLERKFWKAVGDDRTVMLGLVGAGQHSHPMTALLDDKEGGEHGPFWFFTAKDTDMARSLTGPHPAMMQFVSKGHDLFACVDGELMADNNREMIDRLWNPFIAAWFEGKDDPKLQLLRFEPDTAQIWLNENGLFAGIRMLLGRDPKEDYKDKTAQVQL